ncbi:MAG: ATP-binding cassette domain-containing protein, partial [Acidobacteriota bacterium]
STNVSSTNVPSTNVTGTVRLRIDLKPVTEPIAVPVVRVRQVCHDFGTTRVLHDVDLDLFPGEIVLMTGPSGSGKTTLLTLIGALRSLQRGSIFVRDRELLGLGEQERVEVRRGLGFIFQGHNLFDSLTALQNVRLALELHEGDRRSHDERATEMLTAVGLADHLHKKPEALSGGQRQRVAVARALAPRPPLVLADEPTAALDATTGSQVIDLLKQLGKEQGTATVLVTHDNRILQAADRIINMVDGRLVSDVAVGESLEVCEFLAKVPAFSGYTPGALAEIAEQMQSQHMPAGSFIFRQGDVAQRFFIVWQGSVRIHNEDTGEDLAVLETGAFFGEVALLTGQPRNASAIVATDAVLLTLDKADFEAGLEREKNFRDQLREIFYNRQ